MTFKEKCQMFYRRLKIADDAGSQTGAAYALSVSVK